MSMALKNGYSFVQMRMADGDDASCLNLNKIVNPQVLGVDPVPWRVGFPLLPVPPTWMRIIPGSPCSRSLPGGLIPAIADETVIKWGLGHERGRYASLYQFQRGVQWNCC